MNKIYSLFLMLFLYFFLNPAASAQTDLSFIDISDKLELSDQEILKRSIINTGDISRIQKVLKKAESGEEIVIGAIGGSITMGAAASTAPEDRWINLVARWFCLSYPNAKVSLYNAGIGATNSTFGALRAWNDLLKYKPDLVFFEYSINDNTNEMPEVGSEGLLRQLLSAEKEPAVIMVAMMNKWGDNVQEKHIPLARYYQLPFLSLRNLCEPMFKDKSLDPDLILDDAVHPNTFGHRLTARMLVLFLANKADAADEVEKNEKEIPKPLYSDRLEYVSFANAKDLKFKNSRGWELTDHQVTKNQNWRLNGKPIIEKVWTSKESGSILEFEYEGTFFAITYYLYKAGINAGIISIEIDNEKLDPVNGQGEQTWGGMHHTSFLGMDLPYGKHFVKIKLENSEAQKNPLTGFDIIALSFGTR